MEGLAGVVDQRKLFQKVRLSPRWIAAGRNEASVCASYGASGASFEYSFGHEASTKTIEMDLRGKSSVQLHALLPRGAKATAVAINGKKIRFANNAVENSSYVDADVEVKKKAVVEIRYRKESPS
jgi:hypothetical protein